MNTAFPLATTLLTRDDVSGVMRSAFRLKDGKWLREDCIVVGVKKKLSVDEIPIEKIIPATIGGIKTDVMEMNLKPILYSRTYSTVCGGISIGREVDTAAGTLAGIFHDEINGTDIGLTCFHVLAVEGTTPEDPVEYVIHPAGLDNGDMEGGGRIGTSSRWELTEWGDAALIDLTVPGALSQLTSQVVLTDVVMPELLDPVEKVGRTTGLTQGVISALGLCDVDYSAFGYGTVTIYMASFIPVSDPSELIVDGGDSGSLLYNPETKAGIGLVTSMISDPTVVGYACILGYVLEDLDCSPIFANKYTEGINHGVCVSRPVSEEISGTSYLIGASSPLTPRITAIQDSITIFETFEDWVINEGYVSEAGFLTVMEFDTALDYVISLGYSTVEEFLTDNPTPTLSEILESGGITFTDA